MLKNFFLSILAYSVVSISIGQSDELDRRFFFGVNVGVKFANKNYANRYGGWYHNQLRNLLSPNNTQNYNTIYGLLGQMDFFLPNDQDAFPLIVKYTPGLLTGVTMGFKISPNIQAGVDMDFSKLKIRSGFSIVVMDPSISVSQERYRTGYISAEESRFNGRFNLDYIIMDSPLNYIIGLSGVLSAWKIDQHLAFIDTYQMSLFSSFDPTNNLLGPKISGTGWGLGLSLGVEYRFTEKIVAQLMYQPYMQRSDYFNTKTTIANLGTSYIKPKFRLENDITVRILWK